MAWPTTSRHERGYGAAWDRLRRCVLFRDQRLCQPCLRAGRVTAATEVDHIVSKAKGGKDAMANLQAICGPCHTAKTTIENGGRVRPEVGLDGWPVQE